MQNCGIITVNNLGGYTVERQTYQDWYIFTYTKSNRLILYATKRPMQARL